MIIPSSLLNVLFTRPLVDVSVGSTFSLNTTDFKLLYLNTPLSSALAHVLWPYNLYINLDTIIQWVIHLTPTATTT